MNEAKQLMDRLRVSTSDLWDEAITHSSSGIENNERLEFLGNEVLNLCLVDLLYHRYQFSEGKLTKMCNYLRSDKVLNEVGRELGLAAIIKKGASIKDGGVTDAMVAGSLEAIIGALFEIQGYGKAKALVEELVLTEKQLDLALNG